MAVKPADTAMPLTKKGKKIRQAMEKQYGKEEGRTIFYKSRAKGTITGVDKPRR